MFTALCHLGSTLIINISHNKKKKTTQANRFSPICPRIPFPHSPFIKNFLVCSACPLWQARHSLAVLRLHLKNSQPFCCSLFWFSDGEDILRGEGHLTSYHQIPRYFSSFLIEACNERGLFTLRWSGIERRENGVPG